MDTVPHRGASNLIGIGLYTVPEVSRLTGAPSASVRRWAQGYRRSSKSAPVSHSAIWQREIDKVGDSVILSFLDLIEVRFIKTFRKHGVPWSIIKKAAAKVSADDLISHPFSSKRFRTDGYWIFEETIQKAGETKLVNLVRDQYEFKKVVEPSLYKSLVYADHDEILRWFPLWPKKQIVIDPNRSFGRPILNREGVPTRVLADALVAEGNLKVVAQLFDVTVSGVEAAVDFEERLLN